MWDITKICTLYISKFNYFTINRKFHKLHLPDKETIWSDELSNQKFGVKANYGVRIWTLTSFNGLESNALESTERHIGRSRQSDSIVET